MDPSSSNSNNRIVGRSALQQSNDVLVELSPSDDETCMFCDTKDINEKLYGSLYGLNEVILHSFCNLFSSIAVKNDSDNEDILIRPFFRLSFRDVQLKLLRGSRVTCTYCKRPGATISCSIPRCQKTFHLPCGISRGSMHQFFEPFKSFCPQHRVTQNIDVEDLRNSNNIKCYICKEEILPFDSLSSIWAPCCTYNTWFHRDCLQERALNAGHLFNCPMCNNVDVFRARMLNLGIYIPLREASWETNTYLETVELHMSCDVDKCLCPDSNKRNYQGSGPWQIILCHSCGSNGTHMLCSFLKHNQEWNCVTCLKNDKKKRSAIAMGRQLEITSNLNSHTSTTIQGEISTSPQTSNVTQNNIREIPMNLTPRRRTRRNMHNRIRLRNNTDAPQQLIDIISLSSDDEDHRNDERNTAVDSNNSDIQHRRTVYGESSNSLNPQQPMLGNYTSMNFSNTSSRNYFHLQGPSSSSRTRNNNNHSNETVDLTLDDG